MIWFANLRCPVCGGEFQEVGQTLQCGPCGETYPVLHNTPILVAGTEVSKRPTQPAAEAISALVDSLNFAEAKRTELADCYILQFRFSNPVIQTESEQFINRLRSSGLTIPAAYPAVEERAKEPSAFIDNEAAEVALAHLHRADIRATADFALKYHARWKIAYCSSSAIMSRMIGRSCGRCTVRISQSRLSSFSDIHAAGRCLCRRLRSTAPRDIGPAFAPPAPLPGAAYSSADRRKNSRP
jgi:hypothetical protein